jgi:hypothetical protein
MQEVFKLARRPSERNRNLGASAACSPQSSGIPESHERVRLERAVDLGALSLLDEELPFRELEPRFKAFIKRFRWRDPRLDLQRQSCFLQ